MLEHCDADLSTQGLAELHSRLGGGAIIQVERRPHREAREGKCYWDVAALVQRAGGEIVYGWAIFEVPHIATFGWHHAVWRTPSNLLMDISPSPLTGYGSGLTLFISDTQQTYDISWPLGFPQVFQPVSQNPLIVRFIDAASKVADLQLAYMNAQRKLPGAKFNFQTGQVHVPPAVMSSLAALERTHRPAIESAELERDVLRNDLLRIQQGAAQR